MTKHYKFLTKTSLMILLSLLFVLPHAEARRKGDSYINTWGALGYSALFQPTEFLVPGKYPAEYFKSATLNGGAGLQLGVGYEWRYKKKFLLSTGVEFSYFGNNMKYNDFNLQATLLYDNHYVMDYFYEFRKYGEYQNVGVVSIPLYVGGNFDRYYFLVGPKVGIGVFGTYYSHSTVTTYAIDKELIDDLVDMPNHYLSTKKEKGNGKFNVGLNVAAAAEFGLILDEWLPKYMKTFRMGKENRAISYRAALYGEYGFLNISKDNVPANQPDRLIVAVEPPTTIKFNSLLSMNGKSKNVNPFFVGAKFTVSFHVLDPQKKIGRAHV